MPAQEETSSVTVLTWTLDTVADMREFQDAMFDLGLSTDLWRHPNAPADRQAQLQVLLPDERKAPILVELFGTRVRTVTMDDALVSIELLPAEGA
jgi:hypothetical protein